jgi:Domain of unknown function (DUF4351)
MTRFPHDEFAKGFLESLLSPFGEVQTSLVIRQLTRKLENVNPGLLARIEALSLERVELLGEDLLDFTSIDNLEQWLS